MTLAGWRITAAISGSFTACLTQHWGLMSIKSLKLCCWLNGASDSAKMLTKSDQRQHDHRNAPIKIFPSMIFLK